MGGKEQSQAADAFAGAIPDLFIEQYVNRPGAFVVPNASVKAAAMEVVQGTYDAANYGDKFGLYDNWLSIVESGFDVSKQLWELINIRNEPVLKYTADTMKELSLLLDSVAEPSDEESSEEENESEEEPVSASEVEEKGELSQQDEDDDDDDDDLAVHNSDDSGSDVASPAEDSDLDEDDASGVGARRSVVDDDFFSLAEMEGFADEAEEEDMRDRAILAGDHPKRAEADEESSESEDDEEDVDLFQGPVALGGDSDEEDGGDTESGIRADQMMYADFFEPPKGSKRALAKASRERYAKRPKFDPTAEQPESEFGSEDGESEDGESGDETTGRKKNLFDDDSDDEGDGETAADGEGKSEFEKRQEKLQQLIGKLEDEAVEKKHWTMVGEVDSKARPKNSLLEQDLDFDQVQKPVPVITQDVTQTLEDIIKRRILNEEWDDVERKKDIQAKPFKPSQFFELDDKAPKKSLAEEYEEEFMAQKAGDAYVPEKDAKAEEAHKEIDMLFRSLFTQLDALSNFHFAPKPATADIEIRTSAPALHMEEKLPVNVSHAEQLAPEEVYEKNKGYDGRTGDLMGDSEMTREDRKRRRQKKKQQYKKVTSAIEAAKGGRLPAPPKPASQAKTAAKK